MIDYDITSFVAAVIHRNKRDLYLRFFFYLVRRNKPITRENENPLTYLALGSRGQHQHISWHMLEV